MAGPQAIAIAFAAASTAVAGAGALGSVMSGRNQSRIDLATIELNREQGRLKAAEAAQQNAIGFRRALASQVALASMRGGSGSLVRQFSSDSYSNFLRDQEAIKTGVRLNDIQAMNQRASAYGQRAAGDLQALTSFGKTALSAWNMSMSGGAGGLKGGAK